MAQIHCYIPDDLSIKLSKKAKENHLTISKYLAKLVKKDIPSGWPEGYFEGVFGAWEGEPLQRAEQGDYEQREPLN